MQKQNQFQFSATSNYILRQITEIPEYSALKNPKPQIEIHPTKIDSNFCFFCYIFLATKQLAKI